MLDTDLKDDFGRPLCGRFGLFRDARERVANYAHLQNLHAQVRRQVLQDLVRFLLFRLQLRPTVVIDASSIRDRNFVAAFPRHSQLGESLQTLRQRIDFF